MQFRNHWLLGETALEIIDHVKENGVRVVSLERAIIDSIDNYHLGGGLDEVEMAIQASQKLNIEKIIMLLEFYNKAFLYQKIRYRIIYVSRR